MEISDRLLCLYTGKVEETETGYVIDVPKQELELGQVEAGTPYRLAVLSTPAEPRQPVVQSPTPSGEPEPPVEAGEVRDVEIEDMGEQGDGIARVERGYVVIVPETDMSERVRVELTDVRQNVAFGEVVERYDSRGERTEQ